MLLPQLEQVLVSVMHKIPSRHPARVKARHGIRCGIDYISIPQRDRMPLAGREESGMLLSRDIAPRERWIALYANRLIVGLAET
jgi:hypothetical protein